MAGLVAVAAVATIIDVLYPMFQSTLARLKRHMTSPDLSDNLLKLEGVMSSIPDLIRVAESRYTNSSGVCHFVPHLRKLAYAAKDLVDELSYHELHQQVLDQAEGHSTEGNKRNIIFEVLSNFIKCLTSTSKASASSTKVTPQRIQSLIKELDRVVLGLKKAFDVANKLPPSVSSTLGNTMATVIASHRVTTSTVDLQRVCGREVEKQQMMEFLTPEPLIHDKKVCFFAVTGIGRVGKTTLAQYAFNNVKDRFDLAAWICVSDAFDRKRLLQEIIEEITDDSCNITGINTLENTIKRVVKDKTLLLVLDDVWSTEWMKLLLSLQLSDAKCCKVIVTTREVKNITQTHDYESEMLALVGLQGEEYRTLFEEQAFGGEDPSKHRKLREIGEKIARKLKGNPLAAKTVGVVLRENLEIQYWNRVVEDDLWNLGDKPEDIMPALMLSYIHLPPHLRRCFSYCAIFPQDYQLDPETLVWMWIAQGYIVCTNPNESLEDVGLKYFRDLESRSFFAKHPYLHRFYTMHDLLHDLATFVSLDECFIYREESSISNEKALSCHHLSVIQSKLHRLPADLQHIRTLIVFSTDEDNDMILPVKVLISLKSVRVLEGIGDMLGNDWDKSKMSANHVICNDLGRLIHLRYLDLHFILNDEIYELLLESICSLYHLQTLLLAKHFEIEYPNDMNNLINLRHLVGNRNSIARIECIGKLVQLQKLEDFEVGKGSLRNIRQLKEMNQLQGELEIHNICQVEAVEDAKNANMEMKKYLTSLSLKWCENEQTCCCQDSTIEHHDNVLECLKPHNSLEELIIEHHKGSKPPSWLAAQSLQYIIRIELSDCKNWGRIPHLAQLPHLQHLEMEGMDLVVDLTDHVVAFPSLLELHLQNMSVIFEGISEEEGQTSCQFFPNIRNIYCKNCKNLEGLIFPLLLLSIPSTLEDINIVGPCSEELEVKVYEIKLQLAVQREGGR